ncbi:kinesin motor catalytic domain protein (macronuclear) [Tetrahymena thermophila SB210]|uniref:Kinesin motor catalytic domain protein n=1 Tax=Tetrahymena thermophila (strain SB210) TaxID=312017 RepID=I7LUG9_TETTS|nr:kinesin motor catalytic domain protein [Tetrahymena thermophila SB210]EAR93752.2 kinesin motor catalytic domain protein [Tetrahymena thermophila SB210]|eukprot:XP_001013997.2 kinesin motor catalytic domain protein [Tetrahymena thermophila SB210]
MGDKQADDSANIRVICRMRPLNSLEKSTGGETCIEYDEKRIFCKVIGTEKPHEFTFDRVFGPNVAQKDVFEIVASPVIESVMAGYNGTIFCYGQTSSGKTFTMEGPDDVNQETKGLIPRMMDRVFETILNSSEDLEFQIRVSFLEIYNEKVQDLLDPDKNNLQIKENKARGIYVQDATEVYVTSAIEMNQVMKTGSSNRTIAATRMNERSSRSHSLFYLQVFKKNLQNDTTTISKLYFVDLAGSEKISKTNVSGQQLEEAKNINKSLTCLGMVINALTSNGKEHVPYRDSKLTRILQESLGGNARTTLVINISMCSYNDKETLSTLRFGFRAKSIKNKPKKNEEKSAKELMLLLEAAESKIKYQEEIISTLQLQIGGDRASIDTLKSQDGDRKDSLSRPVSKIPKGEHQEQSASMKLLKQHIELVKMREKIDNFTRQLNDQEMELSNKQNEILTLREDKDEFEKKIQEQVIINNDMQKEFQEVINEERASKNNAIQDITILIDQFRRLKSDLSFVLISEKASTFEQAVNISEKEEGKQLDQRQGEQTPKEIKRLTSDTKDSIDKAVEIIEKIAQKYNIDTGFENMPTSEQTIQIDEKKNENIIDKTFQLPKVPILQQITFSQPSNEDAQERLSVLLQNVKKNNITSSEYKEYLSTEEDDIRLQTTESESDYKFMNEDLDKEAADIIVERDEEQEDYENLIQRKDTENDPINQVNKNIAQIMDQINQNQQESKIEEQLLSLQETIHHQNEKIKNLNELNLQAQNKVNHYKQAIEKRTNKCKQAILQQRKFSKEKINKLEEIISTYLGVFEQMQKDFNSKKVVYEKQIMEKNIQINELNEFVEDFKRNIKNKTPHQTISEQQVKIKELLKERKQLFSEIQRLRKENDQKDDKIKKQETDLTCARETYLKSGLPSSQAISDHSPLNQVVFTKSNDNLSQCASVRNAFINYDQNYQNRLQNERSGNNSMQNSGSIHGSSQLALKMQYKNMMRGTAIRGGGGSKSNFEKINNLGFQLVEEDELLERNSSKYSQLHSFTEENSSPLQGKNMKIINTEEEDSRPQAFNLHRSAHKFQQKMKIKNLDQDQDSSSSSQSKLSQSSKLISSQRGQITQQQTSQQQIQYSQLQQQKEKKEENTQETGFINRIKQFFL